MLSEYRKMWTVIFVLSCLSLCTGAVYAYSDGNGTPPEPYLIATVSDWQQLMATSADWNKYFLMTDDVDLQGVSLTPVGNGITNWTGVFEANDCIISNVVMNKPTTDIVGLFGRVGTAGQIRNLSIRNVNIIARNYVGGLAGTNYGGITNCDVTGKVYGSSTYVGGLAGRNLGTLNGCYQRVTVSGSTTYVGGLAGANSGTIINSCSFEAVNGNSNVGGLTGRNSGTVTASYAKGAVIGHSSVGGLIGYADGGNVNTCYSSGLVDGNSSTGGLIGYRASGIIDTNAFWDVNTSDCNVSESAGGVGKTTAEMQNINTYLNGHWDFSTPIWEICDGTNYPKLAWQEPLLGDFNCPDGVGFEDLAFLIQRWLNTNCAATNDCDGADLDIDGKVNFSDFSLFADNWMKEI